MADKRTLIDAAMVRVREQLWEREGNPFASDVVLDMTDVAALLDHIDALEIEMGRRAIIAALGTILPTIDLPCQEESANG